MEAIDNYVRGIKREIYVLSTLFAFGVVAVGDISQDQHYRALPLAFYGAWMASTTPLVYVCYRGADTAIPLILECWYYLTCTAAILFFFGSLGTIDPANVHLWVPVSFNLGIFLAQGLTALGAWVVRYLMGWRWSNEGRSQIPDEEHGHPLDQPAAATPTAIISTPNERV